MTSRDVADEGDEGLKKALEFTVRAAGAEVPAAAGGGCRGPAPGVFRSLGATMTGSAWGTALLTGHSSRCP